METTYFPVPGPGCTTRTLELALQRASDKGINELVVASTTGATAIAAAEICAGMKIVAVSYHAGFREPFVLAMVLETRRALEERGVRVVQATHALSGVERGLAGVVPGVYPLQIVSETLRLFGSGTKVAVEIAIMTNLAKLATGLDLSIADLCRRLLSGTEIPSRSPEPTRATRRGRRRLDDPLPPWRPTRSQEVARGRLAPRHEVLMDSDLALQTQPFVLGLFVWRQSAQCDPVGLHLTVIPSLDDPDRAGNLDEGRHHRPSSQR